MSETTRGFAMSEPTCPRCGWPLEGPNRPCGCLLDDRDRPRDSNIFGRPEILRYLRKRHGIREDAFDRLRKAPGSFWWIWRLDGQPLWATDTGSLDAGVAKHLTHKQAARERSNRNLIRWEREV